MEELQPQKAGFPWTEVFIGVGIFVVLFALATPSLLSSHRAAQERHASTTLKTFTSAEADFRANDRDHNKVADFWTGDVSGLYYVKPVDGGPEVRLIEVDAANADAKPIFRLPPGSGPFQGYRYQSLDWDDSIEGEKGNNRLDTDKSGRKVHHPERFGFCAFPASATQGNYVFFVNENNTTFRKRTLEPRTTWPSDEELKKVTCEDD